MSRFPDDKPQEEYLTAPEPAPGVETPREEPSTSEIAIPISHDFPQDGHVTAPPLPFVPPNGDPGSALEEVSPVGAPLFMGPMIPELPRPVRIPHFGHLLMLLLILLLGFAAAIGVVAIAIHYRLYGVTTIQGTATEIHYTLGSEGLIYVFTLFGCLAIFPLFWHKRLFAGLQWNGSTALRLSGRLICAAIVCFLLALLNSVVLPGPSHTPIEEVFKEPGAAWLLFVFGITFAPFFEEMFFRGFLLPSLCTACDWMAEKINQAPVRALAEKGHPRWSMPAMVVGSILTSIPFAGLHAAQTGYSLGPFLLLVGVSLVLCTVRLWTRSLAASTLVHASYNFLLFTFMLIGTQGFRHMDRM
jgi:uncharacterized protein